MRTNRIGKVFGVSCALLLCALSGFATAEDQAREVRGFSDVMIKDVQFWSDGTRLAGNVLYPKGHTASEKLPALVLCHGWGGTKAHLNGQIAPSFARAGYVVFTFDYRGWGESNSRLIIPGDMPKPDEDGNVTVKVLAVQQLVDPLDQQEDIDAAITFIEGEPGVDPNRIGIWGSSFGGGHVIWRAAHDSRVKCVLAQVGSMNSRSGLELDPGLDVIHANKIKRVRGELAPLPLDDDKPEGLTGSPYYERFVEFVPVEHVSKITVPVLIIDAENEHYFDIKDHGGAVYAALKGRVPTEYHVFEDIGHYDVYRGETLQKCLALQISWLDKYLKGAK